MLRRLRLCYFFRYIYHARYTTSLQIGKAKTADPIYGNIAKVINRSETMRDRQVNALEIAAMTRLPKPDKSLSVRTGLIVSSILAFFNKCPEYVERQDIRRAWQRYVFVDHIYDPHIYKRLTRQTIVAGESEYKREDNTANVQMLGDYLLLRSDTDGKVAAQTKSHAAFFRFYEHDTGGIRSMGLRLDKDHGRISSKGWSINQQSGVMVLGYIINRAVPKTHAHLPPMIDGGASLLYVDTDCPAFVQRDDLGIITMAPILHYQLPFETGPSFSRGMIVRLKGCEHLGGQPNKNYDVDPAQMRAERNEETKKLHDSLRKKFGEDTGFSNMSHQKLANLMSAVSGIDTGHFQGSVVYTGVFQNRPSERASKSPTDLFTPLTKMTYKIDRNGKYVDNSAYLDKINANMKSEIFINFEKPHVPSV
jgi:hypothetical protein